jgi:hypothetical protein
LRAAGFGGGRLAVGECVAVDYSARECEAALRESKARVEAAALELARKVWVPESYAAALRDPALALVSGGELRAVVAGAHAHFRSGDAGADAALVGRAVQYLCACGHVLLAGDGGDLAVLFPLDWLAHVPGAFVGENRPGGAPLVAHVGGRVSVDALRADGEWLGVRAGNEAALQRGRRGGAVCFCE